ncbi:MAG TPA: hypothetical protein ENN18_05140 [Proteobacteria bacterium]|nr:hypothetical protein [Pseudomonadota bacterium]
MNNSKQPNIIVLILDALRADHVSCYGYHRNTTPNIDRLSEQGTVFLETIATAPWTVPSVASIFTGLYPSEHGATQEYPRLDDHVPTLAQILSENGYETIGFSTNPWFNKETNLSKGFKEFKLYSEGKSRKRRLLRKISPFVNFVFKKRGLTEPGCSHDVVDEVIDSLEEIRTKKETPFFLYAHFMDPHLPYQPYKKYIKAILQGSNRKRLKQIMNYPLLKDGIVHVRYNLGLESLKDEALDIFRMAYDAAIRELDDAIGNLTEYLRKSGILDDSVLIIASDHGENIGDHGLMDHQLCLYDTLLKVPLIIVGNGFPKNHKHKKQVQLHQLFYTILEATGINNQAKQSNTDITLQNMIKNNTGLKDAFSEYARPDQIKSGYLRFSSELDLRFSTRLRCVRTSEFKYIHSENGNDEFYDIEADAGEAKNIVHSVSLEKLAVWKKLLAEWQSNLRVYSRDESAKESIGQDEKILSQLRNLGYM